MASTLVGLSSVEEIGLLVDGDRIGISFNGEKAIEGVYLGNRDGVDSLGYLHGAGAFKVEVPREELGVHDRALSVGAARHIPLTKRDPDRRRIEEYVEAAN